MSANYDYGMYTARGDNAVKTLIINPALAEADKPGTPVSVRRRVAEAIVEGIGDVVLLGYPEVRDTKVKEVIYDTIDSRLVELGYTTNESASFLSDLRASTHQWELGTNLTEAIRLMDQIDKRVVGGTNPCPSREEWNNLRRLLASPAHQLDG